MVWDFTCVDTFAPSDVRTGTLSAATGAEQAKELKHRDLEDSYIFSLLPVRLWVRGVSHHSFFLRSWVSDSLSAQMNHELDSSFTSVSVLQLPVGILLY